MRLTQALGTAKVSDLTAFFGSSALADLKNINASLLVAALKLAVLVVAAFAAYIFLRLAILFIMRVAVLWVLIITAPLVFVSGIAPFGREYLKSWWHQLLNWSFLGPIVFFFFFFGLIIWTSLNNLASTPSTTGGAFAATAAKNLEAFSIFIIFPIVGFFFIYALNISKKMAGAAANAVVDSVIGLGKAVVIGGAALGAGTVLAGAGGALLRQPFVKKIYETLQQSGSRPLQATGARLEAAHRGAVEESQRRAKGVYSGLDALSNEEIIRRIRENRFTKEQIITGAQILEERKETLPIDIAQRALKLAPSINKEVERRLKRSAFHARYFSTEPQYAQTGNIRIADAYNYMVTNGIRGVNLVPEALSTTALAGLLDYRQLTEIARRGTFQQLQAAIKGIEELAKTENIPMQLAIASELRKDPGAYRKALEELVEKIKNEPIFSAGRTGEYVAPLDISGGGGGSTT